MDDVLQMPRVFLTACWQVPRLLNAPWRWEFDKPSCYLTPGVDAKALPRSVRGDWANSPLLMKKDSCWQKKGSGKCSHSSRRERAPQRLCPRNNIYFQIWLPSLNCPVLLKARFQHVLSYVSKREYFLLDLFSVLGPFTFGQTHFQPKAASLVTEFKLEVMHFE